MSEHVHDENCEHDDEGEAIEQALELDRQSQIFLELRRQNLDLIRLAAEVAGFTGTHPPLKPQDLKHAMKSIWDVYAEMHSWVDPEEEGDEDGEYEDEDE